MIGSHSVMERPEPVSRVSPPMVTMARMIRAMASSQMPTALRDACMAGSIAFSRARQSTLAGRGICGDGLAMTPHTKKLIGAILMLIWLVLYALFVTGLAVRILPHAAWYVSLLSMPLAGVLWIVPIGLALPWMYAEPKR